jgi:plasmid stabilization system protein ParE
VEVVLSRRARADLIDIETYIAQDSIASADKVIDDILAAFDRLAVNPQLGHVRRDLTERKVRFWAVHSYLIVYEIDEAAIGIVRILSHYRDIAALLN